MIAQGGMPSTVVNWRTIATVDGLVVPTKKDECHAISRRAKGIKVELSDV